MTLDNSLDFAATRVQHTPMRLLIIEDDRDAADYLVKAFREVGHVADWSADGEDGLALALDGAYDVLIVDRMLPKRDGLSVISALRAKSSRADAADAGRRPPTGSAILSWTGCRTA
jgi:CheY-like chemotaxis protein